MPRILAALAAGTFTLGGLPYVSAAPVVTVTEDKPSAVAGSTDGSPATLIVGTEGGGETPVIGSAPSYRYAVGSYYESAGKNQVFTVTDGTAIIRSGTLKAVYGARAFLQRGSSVHVVRGAIEVAGGTFRGDSDLRVHGGYAMLYISSEIAMAKAEVDHSTATITGGRFEGEGTTFAGGYADSCDLSNAGASVEASAHHNRIDVTGGTFKEDAVFYGGYANVYTEDSAPLRAKANDNQLTFEADAAVQDVFGGYAKASGTNVGVVSAEANENTLQIAKGTYRQNVMGGSAFGTGKATANGNTVGISGGTYDRIVYGGCAVTEGAAGSVATARDNTIEITGAPDLSAATLYGGRAVAATKNVAGNALVVKETKGITAQAIDGFQKLDFWIPAGMTKDDTMLTVTSSNPTNIKGAAVTAHLRGDETGDSLRLLHTPNATLATDSATTLTVWKGVSDVTTATIALTDDQKALIVTPPKSDPTPTPKPKPTPTPDVNQQVLDNRKSVVETMAGSAAFLGAGADLMTGGGMASASVEAAAAPGFAPFAAVGGSSLRHKTGSHVDMKGMNLSVGFSREVKRGDDRLIFGPLVEYGRGTYDSYVSDAHGDGSVRYIGGGAFVRQEQKDGTFYEGSLRFGRSSMDYTAILAGTPTSYDTDANYIGAHLGVGQHITEQSGNERELYVRYFYTRQNGTDTKLSTGERYDFDAVDSQRLRTGARWMIPQGSGSLIVGASMQYEFGGDSNATVHVGGLSYTTPSPSLKGFSGSLELGWKAPIGKNATADLSVEGWAGKQRGVTFNAGFNWKF